MPIETPNKPLVVPAWQFFHQAVSDFLMNLRFCVLSIERMEAHPVWIIRLKVSAQAEPCQSPKDRGLELTDEPLSDQIRHRLSRFLRGFGPPVPAGEISVIPKSGPYLWVAFVWPRGKPGFWTPPRSTVKPSPTALGVLGDWAN